MNSVRSLNTRLAGWPVSALVLFGVAVLAVSWRLVRALQGVDLFSDDAYYYTVIARNFVDTGRFTFDGSSLTHGFHPLLFWLEAAGFALLGTGASPMNQYFGILVGVVTVFLLSIAGWVLAARCKPRSEEDAVVRSALLAALCVILVPRFTIPYFGGMESVLVLPLLVSVGILAWTSRYAAAGMVAVLLVMARLDMMVYVVLPMGLACCWRERANRWAALRSLLLVSAPAVIGTLALMSWHFWYFGSPTPISGVLKSCFPRMHVQWDHLFGGSAQTTTLLYSLAAALAAAALLLRGRKVGNDARGAGLTAATLALIQLAAFVLFQKWSKPIPVWYVGPAVLTATFALAVGVANTIGLRRLRVLTAVGVVAVLAVNVASIGRTWYREARRSAVADGSPRRGTDQLAGIVDFMKAQPKHQIWACTDCGKIAFWSDRAVVNLDGLVNDFRYQDYLRDQRLARYLVEQNVRYLVFCAWDRPQTDRGQHEPMYEYCVAPDVFSDDYKAAEFYVYSYKYLRHSDHVRLPREAEVWRSAPMRDGRAMCKLVVFDLDVALRGNNTTDKLCFRGAAASRPGLSTRVRAER